jgi:hypothetical protein
MITQDLIVVPQLGVGDIQLGSSEPTIRAIMVGARYVSRIGTVLKLRTDFYVDIGLCVHYGENGLCEAIEVFPPGRATLFGQRLLGESLSEWIRRLANLNDLARLRATVTAEIAMRY